MTANGKGEPLPSRAQILAIDDVAALDAILDGVRDRIAAIEVDLEYASDKTEDWEVRARGALYLHRSCARRLGERIQAVRETAEAEAQRLRTAAAEANRDAAAAKTARAIASAIEGVEFGRQFMRTARALLPAAEYDNIIASTHEAQRVAVEAALEELSLACTEQAA